MAEAQAPDRRPEGESWRLFARRIDHVGVVVRDIDAAAAHFEMRFSLTRAVDWDDPAGRFRLAYLECGDTTLQLVQPLADGPIATHLRTKGEGLHHICFAVDDLPGAVATGLLRIEGVPYVGGKGSQVCFLSDPVHGVVVELTEGDPETLVLGSPAGTRGLPEQR